MIVHTLTYTPAAGKEVVTQFEWAQTLSDADKQQWDQAKAKQEAIIEKHLNSGAILGQDHGIIHFADHADDTVKNDVDPEWKAMFERFLTETGQTLTITESQA
mgnify:CR=1 FL=1